MLVHRSSGKEDAENGWSPWWRILLSSASSDPTMLTKLTETSGVYTHTVLLIMNCVLNFKSWMLLIFLGRGGTGQCFSLWIISNVVYNHNHAPYHLLLYMIMDIFFCMLTLMTQFYKTRNKSYIFTIYEYYFSFEILTLESCSYIHDLFSPKDTKYNARKLLLKFKIPTYQWGNKSENEIGVKYYK